MVGTASLVKDGADNEQASRTNVIQDAEDQLSSSQACSTPAPNVLPIPTNISSPNNGTFGVPFTFSWDHVWTGCGGYEAEWRPPGVFTWTTTEVSTDACTGLSRCSVEITIPSSGGMSHALRVRSFWGAGNDQREFSDWAEGGPGGNIEMSP